MTTATRDTSTHTVLPHITAYLLSRGFDMQQQDQAELLGMLKGHANAADCAGFEARENQFRVLPLDARDVRGDYQVTSATHSLEGTVLPSTDNLANACGAARQLAQERQVPMIVCDGNNVVRDTFDEVHHRGGRYAVYVSLGEVQDAQASESHLIAEDDDLIDAGLSNLRAAYAVFTWTLKEFRKNGEHVGSVLFIQNYEAELKPIVLREIV